MRTFFRQPLALAGLLFMFMALMSVAGMVPLIGLPIAMTLLPACTLGLMAASREATQGRFPDALDTADGLSFRGTDPARHADPGALYALGFVAVMGLSYLIDGGGFAGMYLAGLAPTSEMLGSAEFQAANVVYWLASALVLAVLACTGPGVLEQTVTCQKHVFQHRCVFSQLLGLYAVCRAVDGHHGGDCIAGNGAVQFCSGSPGSAASLMLPALLLVASMFFTSLYFTYQDSFDPEGG